MSQYFLPTVTQTNFSDTKNVLTKKHQSNIQNYDDCLRVSKTLKTNKKKTKSNTELKKEKKVEKEKKFKKTMDDNKKVITRIFYAPKNFNKGGRVGLKKGGGSDLGMQSVKHGIDNNPNITAADPKAKFIAKAKNKKSKKKFI